MDVNKRYEIEPIIGMIVLGVTDICASHRFYSALGYFTNSKPTDHICFFRASSGHVLALFTVNKLSEDLLLEVPHLRHTQEGAFLWHYVEDENDVKELLITVKNNQGRIFSEDVRDPYCRILTSFVDPDEYLWHVSLKPNYIPERQPTGHVARFFERSEFIK